MKYIQRLLFLSATMSTLAFATAGFAAMAPNDKDKTGSHLHAAPGMPANSIATTSDNSADFSAMLTGDWGGLRTDLANSGFDFAASYTADYLNNVSGGIKDGGDFLDNLDLQLTIDGEKLYGIEGSTLFVYFLNNNGSSFNADRVGSAEGIDNIEVNDATFKLYEIWAEQNFWNDTLSVRAGLYDLNSEFDVTDSSGIFIHPTYGIDSAFAVAGENGPSIFPTTSLAARVRLKPTEQSYIQFVVLDGIPGSTSNPKGTHVKLSDDDGALLVGEAGYGDLAMGRIGLGGWYYTSEQDHLDGAGQRNSNGIYWLAEKTLYTPNGDSSRHVDAFIRGATTAGTVSQFDYSWSTGIAYTGPFAARPDDVTGIAFHGAHNSDPYLRANVGSTSSEWGVELTYAAQITPWLNIQPDLQYINNPGTIDAVDDTWVAGVRTEISF